MPSRIGVILIVALALVDAFILASGAHDVAGAIETHAMAADTAQSDPRVPATHQTLLSTALRQIDLAMKLAKTRKSTGA